jgi:uncharacterized protein YegP (UPF0339 family)
VGKIIRCLVLSAAMAGLVVAAGTTPAPAQEKKDKKATKATGTIEINEGKDGKFRFLIRDAEGALLAMSGPSGFETRAEAAKALDTLKEVLPNAKVAAGKKDDKDKKGKKDKDK